VSFGQDVLVFVLGDLLGRPTVIVSYSKMWITNVFIHRQLCILS
jgi:hypothetical protein